MVKVPTYIEFLDENFSYSFDGDDNYSYDQDEYDAAEMVAGEIESNPGLSLTNIEDLIEIWKNPRKAISIDIVIQLLQLFKVFSKRKGGKQRYYIN